MEETSGRTLRSSLELVTVEEENSSPASEPNEDQWSLMSTQ